MQCVNKVEQSLLSWINLTLSENQNLKERKSKVALYFCSFFCKTFQTNFFQRKIPLSILHCSDVNIPGALNYIQSTKELQLSVAFTLFLNLVSKFSRIWTTVLVKRKKWKLLITSYIKNVCFIYQNPKPLERS